MTSTRKPTQITLGVLMLFVAVCAACSWNLKVLSDHQDEIALIWEMILR